MSKDGSVNKHVTEFLDYYCHLNEPPGFAIMLKGTWGSGKTWFMNQYIKNNTDIKFLYISLYGLSSFDELNYAIYCKLHPLLSSKAMQVVSKVGKGLIKGTIKVDLDSDGRDEGAINSQLPDVNLGDFLNNPKGHILVFDDTVFMKMLHHRA